MSLYSTLLAQIERNLGNREDVDTTATILQTFNNVQKLLARAHTFRELQAKARPVLVIGQAEYTFAQLSLERFRKHYTIMITEDTRDYPIRYYPPVAWDREIQPYLSSSTTRRPSQYTIWAKRFEFYSIPDEEYVLTIRYYQYPKDITATTEAIEFDDVDDILIALTTGYTFESLEENIAATRWLKRGGDLMNGYGIEDISVFNQVATPVDSSPHNKGSYWSDPFVEEAP